jgi:hypothetical protein
MTKKDSVLTVVWRDFICDHCGKEESEPGHKPATLAEAEAGGLKPTERPWAIWCSNPMEGVVLP